MSLFFYLFGLSMGLSSLVFMALTFGMQLDNSTMMDPDTEIRLAVKD